MTPKFRAWDRTRNEMNYKVMVGNCDTDDENWTCPIIWIEEKKDWLHFDDYDSIMQSTGLKDKNGKEIFEGDVLELKDCGETIGNVKVYWDDSLALFQLDAIIVDEKAPIYKVVDDENQSYIVVGNVYKNPELVEEKE